MTILPNLHPKFSVFEDNSNLMKTVLTNSDTDLGLPEKKSEDPARERILFGTTVLIYLFFWQLAIRSPFANPIFQTALSLFSLAMTLLIAVLFSRILRSKIEIGISLVLAAIVTLPMALIPLIPPGLASPTLLPLIGKVFYFYRDLFRVIPGLQGLLLIWLAVSLGVLLSRLVREMKLLLPIAVVLALVDLYVVFGGGLVTQANTGKSVIAQQAMKSLTVPLTPRVKTKKGVAPPPQLAVGFADYLFTAVFFACFFRFSIPSRKTFIWLCGVLCGYLLIVQIFRVDLPALVPIAVVVIGRNLKQFRYEAQEKRDLLIAGCVVLVIMAGLLIASHRR